MSSTLVHWLDYDKDGYEEGGVEIHMTRVFSSSTLYLLYWILMCIQDRKSVV